MNVFIQLLSLASLLLFNAAASAATPNQANISFPASSYETMASGHPHTVVPASEVKVLERGKYFFRVAVPSGDIKVKLPSGWKIFYDGERLKFESNSLQIRGNIGWYKIAPADFSSFKTDVIKANESAFAEEKTENTELIFSSFQLPNKGIGYQWKNRWVPHPKGGTLADFAATPVQDVSLITVFLSAKSKPGYAIRINLSSSANQIDPLLKMMGLLLDSIEYQ